MVAYSFRTFFAPSILVGHKRHTIRGDRKRHARPGEELQLYTGMRTKHCRLIGRFRCKAVQRIEIDFSFRSIAVDGVWKHEDTFARSDGFEDFDAMEDFWRTHNAGKIINGVFKGVLIRWDYPALSSSSPIASTRPRSKRTRQAGILPGRMGSASRQPSR